MPSVWIKNESGSFCHEKFEKLMVIGLSDVCLLMLPETHIASRQDRSFIEKDEQRVI